MDLMPFINKAGCECLNESDEHGFDNCLRKDMTFLESDCDEQVIDISQLKLIGIISVYACSGFFIMFPSHGFMFLLPRWPLPFLFLSFSFFGDIDPPPYSVLYKLPRSLYRILEFLDWPGCWVELSWALTVLKSFCSF